MFRLVRRKRGTTRARARSYATDIPKQYTAAVYAANGTPSEVLKTVTKDLPALGKTHALVKMLFAPINPADLNMVQGSYPIRPNLPAVGGNEGLGQVLAVGNQSKLKVGDFVIPSRQGVGTWRTAAVLDDKDLLALSPDSVKDVKPEYLATLSVNPATAYRMLHDFVSLKPGDVVIQNGSNSMVGLSAMQIAASKGVKTINIIRQRTDYDSLVERMKTYGAYIVISEDYIRTPEFRKLIADLPKPKLALNCVGGPSATEMLRLLAPGGTMVTYGGMSLQPVTVPTSQLIFNDVTLRGFWMSRWYEQHGEADKKQLFSELTKLVREEKLRIWSERIPFPKDFSTALDRAVHTSVRDRKVLLAFE